MQDLKPNRELPDIRAGAMLHRLVVFSGPTLDLSCVIPASVPCDATATRAGFERLLSSAHTAVLGIPALTTETCEWLRRVTDTYPLVRLFLILELSVEHVDLRKQLAPEITTLWSSRREVVRAHLEEAISTSTLDQFFQIFRMRYHDSGEVVRAVELICCHPRPPVTLARIAWMLGVSHARLYRHWLRYMPRAVSPKQLHDWATMVRMVYLSQELDCGPGMAEELARQIGISLRTAHRIPQRCLRLSTAASLARPGETLQHLREWATRILIEAPRAKRFVNAAHCL